MFFDLAGICLLLSVLMSLLTYYCSYKYKRWQGVLESLVYFLFIPAILVFFSIFMLIYSFFTATISKIDFLETVCWVGLFLCTVAMLIPFSAVMIKGIKIRNTPQIETGWLGLLTIGLFLSSLILFFCYVLGVWIREYGKKHPGYFISCILISSFSE